MIRATTSLSAAHYQSIPIDIFRSSAITSTQPPRSAMSIHVRKFGNNQFTKFLSYNIFNHFIIKTAQARKRLSGVISSLALNASSFNNLTISNSQNLSSVLNLN